MESRRIDVIRGLPEVHMIVGVDVLVLTLLVAQNFEGEIGDHLVGVHVGRGARPTLNEVRDELIQHLPRNQPVARAGDRVRDCGVEDAEVPVRHGGGFFHIAKRFDKIRFPRYRHARDMKVLLTPERLDTAVGIRRDLAVTEEVMFYAKLVRCHNLLSFYWARPMVLGPVYSPYEQHPRHSNHEKHGEEDHAENGAQPPVVCRWQISAAVIHRARAACIRREDAHDAELQT